MVKSSEFIYQTYLIYYFFETPFTNCTRHMSFIVKMGNSRFEKGEFMGIWDEML